MSAVYSDALSRMKHAECGERMVVVVSTNTTERKAHCLKHPDLDGYTIHFT